ncbi:hypothetical protein MRX96_045905 [Rhipicephalus microplus]
MAEAAPPLGTEQQHATSPPQATEAHADGQQPPMQPENPAQPEAHGPQPGEEPHRVNRSSPANRRSRGNRRRRQAESSRSIRERTSCRMANTAGRLRLGLPGTSSAAPCCVAPCR